MVSKFLIITEEFLPNPDASGVCAYNLAKVMIQRGHSVEVICRRDYRHPRVENVGFLKTYGIYRSRLLDKKNQEFFPRLFRRINFVLHLPIYPVKSIGFLIRMIRTTDSVLQKDSFDCVLAFNHPLEACITEAVLKHKYYSIHFSIFDVDSFSNKIGDRLIPSTIQQKLFWRWEKFILSSIDQIIVMENHERHYHANKYLSYKEKIEISNFPNLTLDRDIGLNKNDKEILCVHLGTLNSIYRNPKRICDIFLELNNYSLQFYGNTDDLEVLHKYKIASKGRISYNGFVSFEKGQNVLSEANILISIGNAKSEMVPSKIFEYFSYRKPIIHFYSFLDDPVNSYLRKYPLALLINIQDPIDTITKMIRQFIKINCGNIVERSELIRLFPKNTPEYSLNLIEKHLD